MPQSPDHQDAAHARQSQPHAGTWAIDADPEWPESLAGLLAEHAITTLHLRRPDAIASSIPLRARVTDLPRTLRGTCPCTLEAEPPHALHLTITPDRVAWRTSCAELHESLRSLSRAKPR